MKFGGAKRFVLCGYKGEKIRIRLVSDTLPTLQNDFKIKIDDIRKPIQLASRMWQKKRSASNSSISSAIGSPHYTLKTDRQLADSSSSRHNRGRPRAAISRVSPNKREALRGRDIAL